MFEQAFKNIDDILRKESGVERLLCAKSGRSHTNKNPALGWDMFNTCRERKDHKLDVNYLITP
jgi:hypothetical protein